MSRPANAARFGENGVGGTWYNPPYPSDLAEINPWHPNPPPAGVPVSTRANRERAAWLVQQYPSTNTRLGIAGTGFALTQYWLFVDHNRQSWGFDVAWAVAKAGNILDAWSSFVQALDVLNSTQMGTTFRRMGMTGNAKYPVIFTEDLLPAMSNDAEVATARTNLLLAGVSLVHLITPRDDTVAQGSDMLWHTFPEWRALLNTDRIVNQNLQEVP